MHRRSALGLAVLAVFAISAAGLMACLMLHTPDRSVSVSAIQMQRTLERTFPVTQRYFDLIDLTYHDVTIAIDPATRRIHLMLAVTATIAGHVLHGALTADTDLRYEAQRGDLFLDQLRVRELTIEQISPQLLGRIRPMAISLLAEHLATHPLYTLPGTVVRDGHYLIMRHITLVADSLVISFAFTSGP
jgi:hypothetical protein